MEFPMLAQPSCSAGMCASARGQHLHRQGKLAPSNAALCEKAVRIIRDLGGEVDGRGGARHPRPQAAHLNGRPVDGSGADGWPRGGSGAVSRRGVRWTGSLRIGMA
jgi:hypothetical protein